MIFSPIPRNKTIVSFSKGTIGESITLNLKGNTEMILSKKNEDGKIPYSQEGAIDTNRGFLSEEKCKKIICTIGGVQKNLISVLSEYEII